MKLNRRTNELPKGITSVVAFEVAPVKVIVHDDGHSEEVFADQPGWELEETEIVAGERASWQTD